MLNITDKADSTPGATGELTAAEYNDHKNELQGGVTYSGQTLSSIKLNQQAQALFINGVAAASFQDNSAIANSIELTPVTGASGMQVAESYTLLNGAIVEIDRAIANTSTTVTVNIGQTTGTYLGAKSLRMADDTVPPIGSVFGRLRLQWSNSLDHWLIISGGNAAVKSSNTTFTISDTEKYDVYHFSHSAFTGLIEGNLPTLADNRGKVIPFQNIGNGLSYINSEEGGNILYKGNLLDKMLFYLSGDRLTVRNNGTYWIVEDYYAHIESGWISCADWTNRHLGFSNFVYDNQSDSSDLTGQKFTEATSNNTGIVLSDSAPSGNAGTLTVYYVTGTGIFTDGRQIAFGNGVTCDVNEGTTNKNDDNYITHNMGIDINCGAIKKIIVNSTATYTGAIELNYAYVSESANYGCQIEEVDNNDILIQTGNAGAGSILSATGTLNTRLDGEDWYFNILYELTE